MTKHPQEPGALILCVEDEEELRRDLADELIEAGYRVIEATNGAGALEHVERLRPDLILCDISMPVMDGYALLRAVKARPEDYAEIPFVFLTALADRAQVVDGKLQGADDYLVKPIDYDLMLATVEARLRQVRSIQASAVRQGSELSGTIDAITGRVPDMAVDVLNLIAVGIILLDPGGAVRFVNAAGKAIAGRCPELLIGERLSAGDPDIRRDLAAWLHALADTAHEAGVSSFALPRAGGQRDLMLLGCRIAVKERTTADVVVFVADPHAPPALSPDMFASQFGLTRAETQVVLGLLRGNRPGRIAADLDVSQTTVAFHLRNIFQKTGTSHQAGLVALVLTAPAALVG